MSREYDPERDDFEDETDTPSDYEGDRYSGFGTSESRQRLREQERRHISNATVLRSSGYNEGHPVLAYHADLLGKVHEEMKRSGMTPREGGSPAIEEGMERQGWRNIDEPD